MIRFYPPSILIPSSLSLSPLFSSFHLVFLIVSMTPHPYFPPHHQEFQEREYEKWKLRELQRIRRDREEREQAKREAEEAEQRRYPFSSLSLPSCHLIPFLLCASLHLFFTTLFPSSLSFLSHPQTSARRRADRGADQGGTDRTREEEDEVYAEVLPQGRLLPGRPQGAR